jgi:predicted NBD/HSP70 family sugar kinase
MPDESAPVADAPSKSLVRQASLRAVLQAALRQGPISRAELARTTGLSKQTTSEVVRALEQAGWLRVRGQTQGGIGRSAVTYEVDAASALVLGIDLGGTKIHAALANLMGGIVSERIEPTDPRGGRFVVDQIGGLTRSLLRETGVPPHALRLGVIGSPGVLRPDTGSIADAPNIPGFDQFDVRAALRDRIGVEVSIENDVNVAAQGERWQGCCRDVPTFAFVALGTGIGMGLVSEGQIVRGARGAAGEIAFLPIGGDPFDPRGYQHGTLECAIGSEAIVQRYRGLGGTADHVRAIFDLLEAGDAAAATILDDVARLLLQTFMAVRAVFDPEIIVLGGSIGSRRELVDRTRALAARYMADPIRIEASALGSRAAVVGAVGLALTRLHDTLFGTAGPTGQPRPAS